MRVALTGLGTLWLVTTGQVDVFAVVRGGRWRFVGSLPEGAVLSGSTGLRHRLIARGGLLEIDASSVPERRLADGLAAGLRMLRGFTGADPALANDLSWADLLDLQLTELLSFDDVVRRREDQEDRQITAAHEASLQVRERADRALRAVLRRPGVSPPAGDENAVVRACRLAARELGITVVAAADVEQIATRSRFRVREIRLKDRWWTADTGPLVGRRRDDHSPLALLFRRGRYRAVDPRTLTRVPLSEVDDQAVVLYRPLPEKPVGAWQLLTFGVRGTARDVRGLVLSTTVAVLLGLLVPVATGAVLGEHVPAANTGLIWQIGAGLIVASLAAAAFGFVGNIALLRIEGRIEWSTQAAVWDRLLRLPAKFFTRYSTGELASAALGVTQMRAVLVGVGSVALHAGVVALANLALLFCYSVPLALLACGFTLVSAVVFVVLGLRQMSWQRRELALSHRLANKVFQTLRGLPKLRVAAAEHRAYGDWAADFVREKEYQHRVGRFQTLITTFDRGFVPLCTMTLFAVLTGPADGELTTAEFLAFNAAFAVVLTALTQLTTSLMSAIAVVPLYERLKPVLTEPLEASSAAVVPGELSGAIEVDDLTFGYDPAAPPVLTGISFRVRPGEFVAVAGPSGCGKSTLLRLLLGFETPLAGAVRYDGHDLSTLDKSAVRGQCGVVLQHAKPPTGTIFEAIAGAQHCTIDQAWEAAELAGLAADIRALPMGMHTVLSDSSTLSGGQRQRLVIAQALVRRPRLLFFDEATSALDNETQGVVTASTRGLRATRLVIAHRLSTVLDADRVLVLSEGRIAQNGPPAELLADETGLFHRLVHRQR